MGFHRLGSGKPGGLDPDFPLALPPQNETGRSKLLFPQEPTLALHPLPPGF